MFRILKWWHVIAVSAIGVVVVIAGLLYDSNRTALANEKAMKWQEKYQEKIDLAEIKQDELDNTLPGFVAWGDSLTVGAGGDGTNYPNTLKNLVSKDVVSVPVVNKGVGGEGTNTIMARAGSESFLVDEFIIPADRHRVEIKLSSTGGSVSPLRQGEAGLNPVEINGVEGNITIEQEDIFSPNTTYFFERSKSGEEVNVKKGSTIQLSDADDFQNYIPIIFMGQNGGYDDPDDLSDQVKSIVEQDKYNDEFIVLGLTSGTEVERAELEEHMSDEFGNKYINLREELSNDGLAFSEINPTAEDEEFMQVGAVPPSLLVDDVHFNEYGYKMIGHLLYERLTDNGAFDEALILKDEIRELKREANRQ